MRNYFTKFLFLAATMGAENPAFSADNLFESIQFSGSGNCAECHNRLFDERGTDVSIETAWAPGMMANSTRNPYWQAKVASEMRRNPAIEPILNDECGRCHAPMASVEAKEDGSDIRIFGDGFLNPDNPYYDRTLDGVSCTLCHQIADSPKLGTPEGYSGGFEVNTTLISPNRPAYGQYQGPRTNPMQPSSGFAPQYSEHVSESKLCASCHNLFTPVMDANGDVVPNVEFPEQTVFTEWENSFFATDTPLASSCQECHLARAQGVKIANRPSFLPARGDFAQHKISGGNLLMLDILDHNRSELDVGDVDFASAIAHTRETLGSAASIHVLATRLDPQYLAVLVGVRNLSGHKFPTSYPSRRAYIHFRVTDNAGNLVFESGRMDGDGAIDGVATDSDPQTYEPHYPYITRSDQVQVYEAIMQNNAGEVTHTLLNAQSYIKDNRVPPAGFDKSLVPPEIAVAGNASTDANFRGGSDLVLYLFSVNPASIAFNIDAALRYQSLSYGHLQDLLLDRDLPEVARFERMYNQSGVRAETISVAETTVVR